MHRRHHLHQIWSISILAIFIRWRKERDQVKPDISCMANLRQQKMVLRECLDLSCLQRELVGLPFGSKTRHSSRSDSLSCVVVDQVYMQRAHICGACFCIERAFVGCIWPQCHAPVAFVPYAPAGLFASACFTVIARLSAFQSSAGSFCGASTAMEATELPLCSINQ